MKTKLELAIVAGAPPTDFFDPINAPLLEAFTAFLIGEHSNENMLFAHAVREFKEAAPNMTPVQLDAKAREIYNQYIIEGAPSEVNIDHATRKAVTDNLNKVDVNIFDTSFTVVEKLISRDSLKRFANKPEYHNAVQAIEPVQKEYEALNFAYQNEPENNRSHFISELFKQQAEEVEKTEKSIIKYSNSNKDNKKLELAHQKKEALLVRGKALHALVIKKLNPDLEIEAAKKKVKLSQDALDLAESNLAHIAELDSVEKGELSSLKMANQEVDYAQDRLNEATKQLNSLMSEHPPEHKAMPMPAITPMLAKCEKNYKGAHFEDKNKMNNNNDPKVEDPSSKHRPRR